MISSSTNIDLPEIDYAAVKKQLEAAKNSELFDAIVNTPFEYKVETTLLFLGIIVLLQVDKKNGTINRVALSDTELAHNTTRVSMVPFKDIKIPLDDSENIIAAAINRNEPQDTIDWKFLFTPALSSEDARINQASAGIAYSAVYPLPAGDGGALIFSYFQYGHNIGEAQHAFMKSYAEIVTKRLQV